MRPEWFHTYHRLDLEREIATHQLVISVRAYIGSGDSALARSHMSEMLGNYERADSAFRKHLDGSRTQSDSKGEENADTEGVRNLQERASSG